MANKYLNVVKFENMLIYDINLEKMLIFGIFNFISIWISSTRSDWHKNECHTNYR